MPYKAKSYQPPNKRESRPAYRRLYGRQWAAYSKAFLSRPENVFCKECMKDGKEVIANQTDHITPHRGDYGLFWDVTNHQPLCESCHSSKTVKEDGGFGRPVKGRSS